MIKLQKYFPEYIYGAVDGTVTTFAIVAASVGAGLSSGVVLVLGVANVIADGFSMGASALLSAQADEGKKHTAKAPHSVGLATFLAFLVVGMIPLFPYIYDVIIGGTHTASPEMFTISAVLTGVTFIAIGYAKSRIEQTKTWLSVIQTFGLGTIAASLAYCAGEWLARLLGVSL